MKQKFINHFKRLGYAFGATLLALSTVAAPLLLRGAASANGQVTTRSITMSSSAPSATSVTYTVTFTPATTITNPDVLIDFCDNSPIIGDSCTATAGTDTPNFSGASAGGSWTLTTIGSNRGVKLTTSTVTFTAATPTTITLTGVTNPSNTGANGSFYGRIITYATGGAGAQTSANASGYTDYGGIALSVDDNISITAKVFETLTFCVFKTSCGTPATLSLGDTTTGALSSSSAYINTDGKYTLATNAGSGVKVYMTGQTLCRASTLSFANCPTGASASTISAIGATPLVLATNSEQFGMCVDVTGSSLTAGADYTDSINNCHTLGATGTYAGTSKFGFDDTNGANGTNGTSGSLVMSSTGVVSTTTLPFAFLADISNTTEAGIYLSNLNMVATGTF